MSVAAGPQDGGVHRPVSDVVTEHISLADPRSKSRGAFALTPLADVMFQLLIFFMLSSSLSPYALVPLVPPSDTSGVAVVTQEAAPAPPPQAFSAQTAIWQVDQGSIRAGSDRIAPEQLGDALESFIGAGGQEILLFTTPAATTQDVATVLEAIRVSGLTRVRLIGRSAQGG